MTDNDNAREKIAFLRGLRAVRQFRSDPIPQDVLDDVLEVARWSGSASNQQPWEIVLVRKRETLRALAGVGGYARHLGGAAAAIILVMAGTPDRLDQETYDEGRLSERKHWLVRRRWRRGGKADSRHTRGSPGAHRALPGLSYRGGFEAEDATRAGAQAARRHRPRGALLERFLRLA